jgi:aspartyl-tRNA synthetase
VRPAGNENPELPTGDVEVVASDIEVLSESAPLPFPIEADVNVNEEVRLKHRYLDIRRDTLARALRVRSQGSFIVHDVLREHGFVNVETPTFTSSTPEGARDFLVPVRLKPGHWYALPQSPQLYKQLLMVAGMERYYQLARCYRDEDFRADRQPEFTQIDIEMSFVEQEDVLKVAEDLVSRLWSEIVGYEIPRPIPRITYADAMSRYGSDKPDLRFGNELVDMTAYFKDTPFRVFQAPYVGAVVMPGGASQTRKELDGWQDWAKARGAKGLAYVLVQEDGTLGGPVAKNLSETERAGLVAEVGASPGDAVFFGAGKQHATQELLGAARLEIGRRCGLIDESAWAFTWVVDAPMFEETDEGGWTAVHHPFTSPKPEWADSFHDKPGEALASAYDLVCNGNEIGGGSIRIHRAEMQQRVFETLGLEREEAETKFGYLLEAFKYGPPPHGGIAFGWDRVVMLLAGRDTIRDVIAFPKAASGYDPLTGAPTPITPEQRKEAGVDAQPEAPANPPNEPGHIVRPSEERY